MLITLGFGFLIGVCTILVAEAFGIIFLFNRFVRKNKRLEKTLLDSQVAPDLDHQESLYFASKKQGFVWVLESDKNIQSWGLDKAPKEQKKKEVLEVTPVKKHAKIDGKTIILTDTDSSQKVINLKGCTVEAVSATNLPTRKWAKRYPIVVGSNTSVIYKGSKTLYIYFETSWEKESWCKALRIASCEDNEKLKWFDKLSTEFHSYLTSLNAGYPSFMKPSIGFYAEPVDRENKLDGPSSKVKLFLKKITKKASSKPGDERKVNESKFKLLPDSSISSSSTGMKSYKYVNEDVVQPSLLSYSRSQSHVSTHSDTDVDDKFSNDEGALCWNLLISRLFFDAKKNADMKNAIQARIQRTLSNMRTPSYIGEVNCCSMSLGNLPPYIHGMRVLSLDMNEVWAFEVDIEYSGGLVLDIETRLEVGELEHQKTLDDAKSDSDSVGLVTSDLLENFEEYKKQLITEAEVKEDESKFDVSKNSKSNSGNGSKWKSILNTVARQVSQVPLSLGIRIASLRGVMRLQIKPPPSDQIWFGFTSMPDIDFNLDSSVADHKITNGRIATFLVNKFKVAIKDAIVLPNCECVAIPWMLAEKDDWVPRKAAPFMWINQDASKDTFKAGEPRNSHSDESSNIAGPTTTSIQPVEKREIVKIEESVVEQQQQQQQTVESVVDLLKPNKSAQDLRTPLLKNDSTSTEFCLSSSSSRNLIERSFSVEDDDSKPKKGGRRAKMLDLGKKMGEKLEEKRRSVEEKSRNIIEKMRAPLPPS